MNQDMPEPTLVGPFGRAWKQEMAAIVVAAGHKPEDDATVASWVVQAPWAHPMWHSYWLTVVHLRPMADNRPTKIYLEGATHELWLYALNPEHSLKIDALNHFLTPKNFAAQLIEESDLAAAMRIEEAVEDIVNGRLNPDTDALRQWRDRFGDNMVKAEYR